jgi:hypothetical protein
MGFQFILILGSRCGAKSAKTFCFYCDAADRMLLELMHRGDDLRHQIGTR